MCSSLSKLWFGELVMQKFGCMWILFYINSISCVIKPQMIYPVLYKMYYKIFIGWHIYSIVR